jgi:predicted N-acetyltransferase YhbS
VRDNLRIDARLLARDEIATIWTIDRTELVEAAYALENGALVVRQVYFDVRGWPPGEHEKYTPIFEECIDHGGAAYGLFDAGRLIGAAILEGRFIGAARDRLQLKFIHVSHAYRHRALGQRLFQWARSEALRRGARRLYVSATPSKHTIDFYVRLGCRVATEVDADLFALEPEDIHLECVLARDEVR